MIDMPNLKLKIYLVNPIKVETLDGIVIWDTLHTDTEHCDVMSNGVWLKFDDGRRWQIFNTNILYIEYGVPND